MMYKHVVLATGFAATLAATGIAQAQTAQWTEIEDESMMVPAFNMSVDDMDDMDLYDATGERIGEVDDILIGDDGTTMAASLDVGGFLGIGEKDVVLPLDSLRVSEDGLVTNMSKEELESLPEYDD